MVAERHTDTTPAAVSVGAGVSVSVTWRCAELKADHRFEATHRDE